ncbi:MAG: hypothetical protein ABSG53_12450 [Thermoguttaceae bacterium]|jgi:hypothetical protein
MPRPRRIDFPDAVYHVTGGGNCRAEIFWSDDDRQWFLAQLAHHLHLAAVAFYGYVLPVFKKCGRERAAALPPIHGGVPAGG